MLGAALIPALAGVLAETWGLQIVAEFAVLLAGLLFQAHELLLNVAGGRSR
jgi:fucose permease